MVERFAGLMKKMPITMAFIVGGLVSLGYRWWFRQQVVLGDGRSASRIVHRCCVDTAWFAAGGVYIWRLLRWLCFNNPPKKRLKKRQWRC